MELFKGIRLVVARLILNQRLKRTRRNKKFNNLRHSHKIGIVWDGSNIADFEAITSFYHEMLKRNIQVDIICYYPKIILPDQYTAIRYLTCIKKTDLNWFYIPQSNDIDEFIHTPYEILIDINNNNYFPVKYITVLSQAEFKVGAENLSYRDKIDMTIKINRKNDPVYYLEQVKYYLEMINTGA
ncbi:MAG TPA: hypothetical protein DEQ09_11085 [Bacteroidales bacterium]|nr:hypothetical protein [Bacteroidales bacterium]